jgi:Leucine-rich repeat (LRR) protein
MKKLLYILILPITLFLASCGGGEDELQPIDPINPIDPIYAYVPDNNFEKNLIDLGLDNTLNDTVLVAAIDTLTFLDLAGSSISNLTGIERFSNLITLICNNNNLTEIDVSNNLALVELRCNMNNISQININANLLELSLFDNNLQSLDVSNSKLESLSCGSNNLANLNVSGADSLTQLTCDNNKLTNLDLTSNSNLRYLNCDDNLLTTINLNSNLNLTHLYCENNNLGTINLSQNFYLRELWLRYNSLTDLDFRNGNNTYLNNFKLRYNPYLYCIDVDNVTYSSNNWVHIDAQSFFSEDCGVK